MNFLSNENKYMLWSVLQESDVFQNIPNERFKDIRAIFDSSLAAFSQNNQGSNEIVSMNKEIIPILLGKVHSIANSQNNDSNKNKLEVVYSSENAYKVEDIHKKREEEFNNKMQDQQHNMNELLQPKKPKEVSFADTNEDKPIGGEMDEMIQNMLTSRERELETLSSTNESTVSDAKNWIKSSNTNVRETKTNTIHDVNKPITEIVLNPDGPYENPLPLISKFKKKDPIMDELKELKQNQLKLLSLVETIISSLAIVNEESIVESNV